MLEESGDALLKGSVAFPVKMYSNYLIRGDRLVVALECVDGFGVAKSPPLVSLDRVGFCQQLQLLSNTLIMIHFFAFRGLSTNPLASRKYH